MSDDKEGNEISRIDFKGRYTCNMSAITQMALHWHSAQGLALGKAKQHRNGINAFSPLSVFINLPKKAFQRITKYRVDLHTQM